MIHPPHAFLAQAADAGAASWFAWAADQALALTILVIFGGAILSAVLTQWRRDKCLKLLRGDHATVVRLDGGVLWGDLIVYPKALELTFDAPFVTTRGLVKSGVMLPEADVAGVHLVARSAAGLTPAEQRHRESQIRRTFRPGLLRRWLRTGRNLLNTLRDAFGKALSAILSAVTRNPRAAALADQKAGVEGIGQQLIGAAGNAYDPLLEAHVGRPVVVKLRCPGLSKPEAPVAVDVPGYLVDYSDAWIAVFNVDHTPLEALTLEATAGQPADADPRVSVTKSPAGRLGVRNPGPAFVLVRSVDGEGDPAGAGGDAADLDAVVPPGATLWLGVDPAGSTRVRLELTERLDLVIPRGQVVVRHAGDRVEDPRRGRPARARGLAPRDAGAGGHEPPGQPTPATAG
ncbi:hypothetical protein PSMK_01360 [Phycisphaera mikurensis NBRC 102666]|uniref:Uncharacterized protein n=2 Tax=Phycisphaera TaxID=666508 RepID=I0IAK7_PHYMF|nr:hypothetical protein PSMK_01360 [Phycisphaera mikurensis NBRC 102666]